LGWCAKKTRRLGTGLFCSPSQSNEMKKITLPSHFIPKDSLKYIYLLLRPVFAGMVCSFIWYLFYTLTNVAFNREDLPVFESLLSIIGFAHATIVGVQINKVYTQYQNIQVARATSDFSLFKASTCVRISVVVKGLLVTFSLVFYMIFLVYPFACAYSGIISVWITIFIIVCLWEVSAELDDPFHGVWKLDLETLKKEFPKHKRQMEEIFSSRFSYHKN
jgi:hypothetical protein